MNLRQLLSDLARDRGVTIDQDDLDLIGLADDEESPPKHVAGSSEALSGTLPGSASGLAEIFLAAPKGEVVEKDGLLWSPIAVEGQWAMRPDGKGGKVRAPLQLVAGHSINQRRKIGMKNILDNFDDRAVDDVTIPTTHNNGPLENTGFVEQLAIVDGKVNGKTVKVLMAGEKYTDPVAKKKVKEGSTRGRSMGLLYDYTRTDTGKLYDVALEHVALTPKPWLRGMPKLARPLSDPSELATVSLSLSDDGPDDAALEDLLAEVVSDDTDFLAEPAVTWSHEESPRWLSQQVDDILRQARQDKQRKRQAARGGEVSYVEESLPYYRCVEARPGAALIADGYGDGANYWLASITVTDGKVVLADFKDWKSTKQAWVPDDREQPKGDKTPLSEVTVTVHSETEVTNPSWTALQFAQHHRRSRTSKTDLSQQDPTNSETTRGGGEVAGSDGSLQLSDEARKLIQDAQDQAAAAVAKQAEAELKLSDMAKKVDKLVGTQSVTDAERFITHLKTPIAQGGIGLSEELGFSGMLVELEQVLLADDGEPAVQSDHFADDDNKEGTLTLSEAFARVFGALRTAEGSTLKLAELISPPVVQQEGKSGKPPKEDAVQDDESNLSDEELVRRQDKDHPGALAAAGMVLAEPSANGKEGA